MNDDEQVDWQMLMRFGLGVLRLGPRDFWDMTPCEFLAATEGRFAVSAPGGPLDRTSLASLMRQHPDET